MAKETKNCLVTGANKGIGFEICRQLAKAGMKVILTARNKEKGMEATERLKTENLDVVFYQLDVTDDVIIKNLAAQIEKDFSKLDVLINNAGIRSNHNGMISTEMDVFKKVMETNYYGPMKITRALFPVLKKSYGSRVINVSSKMGSLDDLQGDYAAYRLSKASLNALTIMFANEFKTHDIEVNAMHPGWVRTDLGGANAPRTTKEGADTAFWLATAENIQTGKFFSDREEISW